MMPKASIDLNDILDYMAKNLYNPKAANDFLNKFDEGVEYISETPSSCPACETNKDYRKIIIGNYIIFFKIFEVHKKVVIFRVLYGMMDYEKHL